MLVTLATGRVVPVLLAVGIGWALAIRMGDGSPLWRRVVVWSGIASTTYAAVSAIALGMLVLLSDRVEFDPPPIPASATVVESQSDPTRLDVAQNSVTFAVPSSAEPESVVDFYSGRFGVADGWIPSSGLNQGEWCWARAGADASGGDAVVLTSDTPGEYTATALKFSPASLDFPEGSTTMDCSLLLGLVTPATR